MEFLCKLLHMRKYIFLKPICSATTPTSWGCEWVCVRAHGNKCTNTHTHTHRLHTFLETTFKLRKENEITGVCSGVTVFLFNDRIKNKCPLERNLPTVPETIQCNLLDPANRMSCQWSGQEYLPWSLGGRFCPLVHTEGRGTLSYRGTCWVWCRLRRGDTLARTLLGGGEEKAIKSHSRWVCQKQPTCLMSKGREGETVGARHKWTQKVIKTRRAGRVLSDLQFSGGQTSAENRRPFWRSTEHGNKFDPVHNWLLKTSISVLSPLGSTRAVPVQGLPRRALGPLHQGRDSRWRGPGPRERPPAWASPMQHKGTVSSPLARWSVYH